MTLYFTSYFLLDTLLDIFSKDTRSCIYREPSVLVVLILHHLMSCFLLGGWLFKYVSILIVHILVVIGTTIYWCRNQNLCDLTVYVNKRCGWNSNKPFHDLLDMIGLKELPAWNERDHYIFILLGATISLYKIIHNLK